jgi:YHS domain-containing protein
MVVFFRRFWVCLALLFGALAGAQTYESPNEGPFRTVSDGPDDRLMLMGYDAVGCFIHGEALKGDPAIKAEHLGATYRFATESHTAEFQRSPQKYMPQFGGFYSNGINCAVDWGAGGGPDTWRI